MLAIILFKDRTSQITLSNVGDYIPFIHRQDLRIQEWPALPAPRIFRNEQPIFPELYPKIIYLLRDPRAVIISFYHMYRIMRDNRTMTLQSFLDQYIATDGIFRDWNAGLERWDRQVLSWTARARSDAGVLIVKYEDLVADRRRELMRLAKFVDFSYERQDLDLAVERGSFEAMRKNEEQYGAEAYRGEIGERGRFVRRGEVAGWKDELDTEISRRIETEFATAMKATGYLL